MLRLQSENDGLLAREKSVSSEGVSLQNALAELRQERDRMRESVDALTSEVQELKDRLVVAEEERDAAREKEEDYFRELEEKDEQISRIQEGYVRSCKSVTGFAVAASPLDALS